MPYSNPTGLPSATEVIKVWVDTRWFTPESCRRGDQVNEQISSNLLGEFFICRPEYEVYIKSFEKFQHRIGEVILVEERLSDYDLGYCGQPDIVFVDSEDGVITLCDWKTAVATARTWPLQLGGYSILLKSQKNINVGKIMSVRLRKELDRRPLINVYSVKECERLFLNQLELYKLLKGRKT